MPSPHAKLLTLPGTGPHRVTCQDGQELVSQDFCRNTVPKHRPIWQIYVCTPLQYVHRDANFGCPKVKAFIR